MRVRSFFGAWLECSFKYTSVLVVDKNFIRIVNFGSLAGKEGLPTLGAYSAASGGVIAFTKALSRELARAMGGELAVDADESTGATFVLSLRAVVRAPLPG